jgi:hypothetical protein
MTEEQIKETFDSLDSNTIKNFLSVVELSLSESKNAKHYDLVNSVYESVVASERLSFKQYRCMMFFTENYLERCKKISSGAIKTF